MDESSQINCPIRTEAKGNILLRMKHAVSISRRPAAQRHDAKKSKKPSREGFRNQHLKKWGFKSADRPPPYCLSLPSRNHKGTDLHGFRGKGEIRKVKQVNDFQSGEKEKV